MVGGQNGHRQCPPLASGGKGKTASCFLTGLVAVEAENRRCRVQADHSGELCLGQFPAGLGDRAELVALAGADRRYSDGHGVEGAFDDDDLSVWVGWCGEGLVEVDGLVVDGGAGWVLVFGPEPLITDVASDDPDDTLLVPTPQLRLRRGVTGDASNRSVTDRGVLGTSGWSIPTATTYG